MNTPHQLEPHGEPEQHTMSYFLVRRLVTISLIFGLLGGAVGSLAIIRYAPGTVPVDKRQLVVQENSAAIDVAKKVSPSVVSITSETTARSFFGVAQTTQGAGTGIIVSSNGLILTNKHVVPSDASNFSVFTSDGHEYKNAKVVARDPRNDVAFVQIDAHGLKSADLGDSGAVAVGQKVLAIGNALGQFQNTVTEGIISGLGRPVSAGEGDGSSQESLQDLFQTDAAINPGNSGGPLVNLEGQVIGINTAVAGNAQNIGFAIPINAAKVALENVRSQGKIIHPYLGVRYVPLTKAFASANDIKLTDGAYVTGDQQNAAVVEGSPAAKAGFKEGDIITNIGNDKIDATHNLTTLIDKHKVGEKVSISYVRAGKSQHVDVTLQEAKE